MVSKNFEQRKKYLKTAIRSNLAHYKQFKKKVY